MFGLQSLDDLPEIEKVDIHVKQEQLTMTTDEDAAEQKEEPV